MSLSQYMIIGKFIPTNSFIHKLDARTKLVFILAFVFLIFIINTISGYLLLSSFVILGIYITKIPIGYYIKGLIPIVWILLFTTIIHLIATKDGVIIFEWKWIVIYSSGLEQAIFIAIRLLMLVLVASMLTLTTQPIDITIGLEKLLSPLRIFRIPVNELALMMALALRFIPTLLDETDKIIIAQKARGANFESGKIHKRFISILAIIIPLFISTFKRADELAMAMESRGYRGGEKRTRLRVLAFTWRDFVLVIIFCVLLSALLYLRGL